jgi:DNA-binding GntR family transcriptional regulator
MAVDRIIAIGLARSCPAMSGAEPCAACAIALSLEAFSEGAMPNDPANSPARSDRMSPNMFSVTTTSNSLARRTPLREALRRLKSEGLVELDAHRDAHIAPLRVEEARDLLELRKSLDPLAAELAAQRRTNADIQAIRTALAGLQPLPSQPAIGQLVAHRNFHAAIYRASHNDLLITALEGLWDKADRYRRLALQTDRGQAARDQKADEHQMLVDFIAAGDSEGAGNIMRAHIDTSLGATAVWRLGHDETGE